MVSERKFPITHDRRDEINQTAEKWLKDLTDLTEDKSQETIKALTETLVLLEEKTGQPFKLPDDNPPNPDPI